MHQRGVWNGIAGAAFGLLLGMLTGLSVSPVVGTVIGVLGGLAGAFLTFGLPRSSAHSRSEAVTDSVAAENYIRFALFCAVFATTIPIAVYIRAHDKLAPSLATRYNDLVATSPGFDKATARRIVALELTGSDVGAKPGASVSRGTSMTESAAPVVLASHGFLVAGTVQDCDLARQSLAEARSTSDALDAVKQYPRFKGFVGGVRGLPIEQQRLALSILLIQVCSQ